MKFKIAVVQFKTGDSQEDNLTRVSALIRKAAGNKAELVVLPEMFNCPYRNDFFPVFAESFPGKTTSALADLAKELGIYLIGGSIPEQDGNELFNTSFIFDRSGEVIGKHRKAHLFDVCIENGICFKESETLVAGDKFTVVDTDLGKIGVAICYDMRFPELIRKMALTGAKLIVVPAAFNMTTGPAHWHLTARSRALDNQVYFIAASPARDYEGVYTAFGHSLLVNPWGTIVAEAGEAETILYGEVDYSYLDKVRAELPLLQHRREELY